MSKIITLDRNDYSFNSNNSVVPAHHTIPTLYDASNYPLSSIQHASTLELSEPKTLFGLDIDFPVPVLQPMGYQTLNGDWQEYNDQFQIVDAKTGTKFGRVSNRYQLIPYEQSIQLVVDALTEATIDYELDVKFYSDRGIMVATFKLPKFSHTVGLNDIISMCIQLITGYKNLTTYQLNTTAERLACLNGMTVGKAIAQFKHRHTKGLTFDSILHEIDVGTDLFRDELNVWESWKTLKVNPNMFEGIINEIGLQKKDSENLMHTVEISSNIPAYDFLEYRTLTLWDMYNLFTQYFTHEVKTLSTQHRYFNGLKTALIPYRA